MIGITACLAVAAMGVDFGWQPVAGGGVEYIIQIEPQMLERLKAGEDIFSDLPPQAGGIRGYRITVGTALLPHHGQPPPSDAGTVGQTAPIPRRAVTQSDGSHAAGAGKQAIEGPLPGPVLTPVLRFDTAAREASSEPPTLHQPDAVKPMSTRPTGFEEETQIAAEETRDQQEHASVGDASSQRQEVHEARRPNSGAKQAIAHRSQKPQKPEKSDSEVSAPAREASEAAAKTAAQSTRPSVSLIGLFASLSANAFLLWVAVSQRSRYRALATLIAGPRALQNHE